MPPSDPLTRLRAIAAVAVTGVAIVDAEELRFALAELDRLAAARSEACDTIAHCHAIAEGITNQFTEALDAPPAVFAVRAMRARLTVRTAERDAARAELDRLRADADLLRGELSRVLLTIAHEALTESGVQRAAR